MSFGLTLDLSFGKRGNNKKTISWMPIYIGATTISFSNTNSVYIGTPNMLFTTKNKV